MLGRVRDAKEAAGVLDPGSGEGGAEDGEQKDLVAEGALLAERGLGCVSPCARCCRVALCAWAQCAAPPRKHKKYFVPPPKRIRRHAVRTEALRGQRQAA